MTPQTQRVVAWLLIGLIAGGLASLLVGGGGLIGSLIAGLIGSVVGGYLADRFNLRPNFNNPFLEQIVVAFVGAVIVIIVARIIT